MSDKKLLPTSRSSFEWDGTKITRFIGKETKVVIPEDTTAIEDMAFASCRSLKSVVIPEGVTGTGYGAFWGCSSLTSVVIPEGVTRIDSHAFLGCRALTSVVIPRSVTVIGGGAFKGCPVPRFSRAWWHKIRDDAPGVIVAIILLSLLFILMLILALCEFLGVSY